MAKFEPEFIGSRGKGINIPKFRIRLPKGGEFEFRYLIDGDNWINDNEADTYRENEHGSENGVVSTIAS